MHQLLQRTSLYNRYAFRGLQGFLLVNVPQAIDFTPPEAFLSEVSITREDMHYDLFFQNDAWLRVPPQALHIGETVREAELFEGIDIFSVYVELDLYGLIKDEVIRNRLQKIKEAYTEYKRLIQDTEYAYLHSLDRLGCTTKANNTVSLKQRYVVNCVLAPQLLPE